MNCPWYLTEPWVPHAINALAAALWTAMLGYALWKRRFYFGRLHPFGRKLIVDGSTHPKAFRYLVLIYALLMVGLIVEAIAWPWPLGAGWYASGGCGGWTGPVR